jgi:hypothetical protein
MSLEFSRAWLNRYLPRANAENKSFILGLIDNWWIAYKDWEEKETFTRAFTEKRMTVRTIKYQTVHSPLKMTREAQGHLGKQEVPGKSDTGIKGLTKRMDPTNFVSSRDRSSAKYEHGLHDMSASLLHPERLISHQLYGWGFQTDSHAETREGSVYVVFMPLPQTEDMVLYSTLSALANQLKGTVSEIYEKVRDIRSQMTRIKFADKDDSHIGFVDVSKKPETEYKYRYGLVNGDAEAGSVDTPTMRLRKANALKYTCILETAQERALRLGTKQASLKFYNEIIVAYRMHASATFPLVTRWNENCFQVVEEVEAGMKDVPGKTIAPNGKCTGI